MVLFSANQIKFDKEYLNELTSESGSGVFKQPCKYHIALHPAQLNGIGQSLRDELDKRIARYDDTFHGLMLGYENIKLPSELGVIGMDNCYIHVDIQALFFIFRPEVGMMLKGTVTRTTKDHVGCLLYNTFNISLPKPPDEDNNGKLWLGDSVTMNSQVEFKLTYVDLTARLPHIRGELMSIILTEGVDADSSLTPIKSKKKKKKHYSENAEANEEVQDTSDTRQSKRKGKKIRFPSLDESSLHTELIIKEDVEDELPQKKSKKKHKEKHAADETEIKSDLDELEIKLNTEEIPVSIKEDVEDELPQKKSKKKHREKHAADETEIKSDLDELEIKLNTEEIPVSTKKSRKKAKKDKHRHKEEDLDISLESLDIKSLFSNTSLDFDETSPQSCTTADSSEKRKHRRSHSASREVHLNLDNIKLEADSDLEHILGEKI